MFCAKKMLRECGNLILELIFYLCVLKIIFMKKFALIICFFLSNLILSQNQIIVGPQNDCALKKISKNVHTSSEWFDVKGVTKLKINTLQHRTYDKSRIYNEDGILLWEWLGESYSDTWYRKEHFLEINTNKIKVEFTQGYSDPFCNGFVQVEKISFNSQNINSQDVNITSNINDDNQKKVDINEKQTNIEYFNPKVHTYIKWQEPSNQPYYVDWFGNPYEYAEIAKIGNYNETQIKLGLIDKTGKIIIKPEYHKINLFSEGLIRVCKKISDSEYLSGFINQQGEIVIPFIYGCDISINFSEGLCAVRNSNGLYGFIDKKGKAVIPFIYKSVIYEGFKNGYAIVSKNDNIDLVINKQGKIVRQINRKSPCENIILEYEKFAKNFIKYSNSVKVGTVKFNIQEYVKWENAIREQNDNVMQCATTTNNRIKILKTMENLLVAVQSTYGNSSSSSSSSTATSTSSSTSSSTAKSFGKSSCTYCKPKNEKGWYVQDFNSSTRTYKNGRYILRPGYKTCESCQGTGNCRVKCSRGKTDCPGICEDDDTCSKCDGDRFVVCNYCKGKG
jgi:hypothetical protein